MTFRQLRNGRLYAKFGHGTWIVVETQILDRNLWKISIQGSFAPKPQTLRGQTGTSLQLKGCTAERYCLFHVVFQGTGSLWGGQLFCTTYCCQATGRQFAQFSDFGLFSPYKTPKTYFPVTNLQLRGLHRRMIPIFPCGSRRSKWVPSGSGVSLQLLVGELWTPKLAQFSPMANGSTHTECYYTACQIWTKYVWILKTHNSEDECTFPPNIFAPTPKITPKLHFGGPFNAKPIIQKALRKSHVNGATKLKLYSYIDIGKY